MHFNLLCTHGGFQYQGHWLVTRLKVDKSGIVLTYFYMESTRKLSKR